MCPLCHSTESRRTALSRLPSRIVKKPPREVIAVAKGGSQTISSNPPARSTCRRIGLETIVGRGSLPVAGGRLTGLGRSKNQIVTPTARVQVAAMESREGQERAGGGS